VEPIRYNGSSRVRLDRLFGCTVRVVSSFRPTRQISYVPCVLSGDGVELFEVAQHRRRPLESLGVHRRRGLRLRILLASGTIPNVAMYTGAFVVGGSSLRFRGRLGEMGFGSIRDTVRCLKPIR